MFATLATFALSSAALVAAPNAQQINAIEARLWWEDSGTLSPNILDKSGRFAGWNTIIGEGPSGGAARDLVVAVAIGLTKSAEVGTDQVKPLQIVVTTKDGKPVAKRTVSHMLLPYRGSVWTALYIFEVGCAGSLLVTARMGDQVRKARLDMDCGE